MHVPLCEQLKKFQNYFGVHTLLRQGRITDVFAFLIFLRATSQGVAGNMGSTGLLQHISVGVKFYRVAVGPRAVLRVPLG